MPVPLLDLTRQHEAYRDEIEDAVLGVLRSGRYILGPEVEAFESEVAAYVGTAHAVGLSSGTDALLAALMALDVGAGDAVLLPTYTFFATAGVVARLGARPVFVDVDPTWQNIDPDAVARALDAEPDIKAALLVHLYGAGCDVERLLPLCEARGIPVIEDAAQAIGTRIGGRMAGTFGRAACYSTFPSKNLGGAGDGGFLTTDDAEFAARIRSLRNHGMGAQYRHDEVGGNFRLDALQAAVLRVKLRHIEALTEARRANAARYARLFEERGLVEQVCVPLDVPDRHAYHQYVVHVRATDRDRLLAGLRERDIGCAVYYPIPLHQQPCFANLRARHGDFPVAERASRTNLALPIFPELREDEAVEVVDAIAGILRG